ncbi:MAG: TIGR04076 family protein [Duncaniella sp.]|nr:TIGR04076 family protein [Duncaniella sp.]MDE6177885.1 TIGR04076 family protein [Duncaniella sp.]
MNRRQFCKIAALTAGAFGLGGLRGSASVLGRGLLCGRVTVVRCECYPDLQSLYLDDPETGPCRRFRPGDCWDLSRGLPPDFCPRAREVIEASAERLASCPGGRPEDRAVIVCCPDGTRPVVFRIEKD